jgi:hypothetical protein
LDAVRLEKFIWGAENPEKIVFYFLWWVRGHAKAAVIKPRSLRAPLDCSRCLDELM